MVKAWLKDARMERMKHNFTAKQHTISSPLVKFVNISADAVEATGLSELEKLHIARWVGGLESGRSCLLSILDNRQRQEDDDGERFETSSLSTSPSSSAQAETPIEIALLSSTVNLPTNFLCSSNLLFAKIFSRQPGVVLREALALIKVKSQQQALESLSIDQFNLAIKQLRVDILAKAAAVEEEKQDEEGSAESGNGRGGGGGGGGDKENDQYRSRTASTLNKKQKQLLAKDEEFCLQIMIELIRGHVLKTEEAEEEALQAALASATATASRSDIDSIFPPPPPPLSHLPFSFASSSSFPFPPSSTTTSTTSSALALPVQQLNCELIQEDLRTPLELVLERAVSVSAEDLESSNNLLKPYVKQLTTLRANLAAQLKDIEDSRAFLSLGVSKEASDAAIKKAYHALAVRLHPDKGGDTAKFQQLQDAYQEVLKKKRAAQAEEEAVQANQDDPVAQSGAQRARSIANDLAKWLSEIKLAAEQCTALAQLNMQLQAIVEEAASGGGGQGNYDENGDEVSMHGASLANALRSLQALVFPPPTSSYSFSSSTSEESSCGGAGVEGEEQQIPGKKKKTSKKEKKAAAAKAAAEAAAKSSNSHVNVSTCAAQHAVAPMERICELLQLAASKAMELPNCGARYGIAAATSQVFVASVEQAMASGLNALKSVTSLMTVDKQLASCLSRFEKSCETCLLIEEEEEVRAILREMIITAFKSSSVTVSVAAERAVAAVMTISDLLESANNIVEEAEKEVREEAERKATRKEMEEDYCEEDKKAMQEMRKKAMEEDAEDRKHARARKEQEDEQERKEMQEEEDSQKGLDKLRDKIKKLQVQLRVQHVKSLQTLNSETRQLQQQVQAQLLDMHSMRVANMTSPRSSSASSSSSSTSSSSSSSSSSDKPLSSASATSSSSSSEVSSSALLTLIADCIDSSCFELKSDFTSTSSSSSSSGSSSSGSEYESEDANTDAADAAAAASSPSSWSLLPPRGARLLAKLKKHLGWLLALRPVIASDDDIGSSSSSSPAEREAEIEGEANEKGKCDDDVHEEEVERGVEEEKGGSGDQEEAPVAAEAKAEDAGVDIDERIRVVVEEEENQERCVGNVNNDEDAGEEEVKGDAGDGDANQAQVPLQNEPDETREKGEAEAAPTTAPAAVPPVSSAPVPLALLPDCRSRALWLSALLDGHALCEIITNELHSRLNKDLFVLALPMEEQDLMSELEEEDAADKQLVARFCKDIVMGIKSVRCH